jgi:hypothetical protein
VLTEYPDLVGGPPRDPGLDEGVYDQNFSFPSNLWMGRGSTCGEITNLNRKLKQFGWNPRTAV